MVMKHLAVAVGLVRKRLGNPHAFLKIEGGKRDIDLPQCTGKEIALRRQTIMHLLTEVQHSVQTAPL